MGTLPFHASLATFAVFGPGFRILKNGLLDVELMSRGYAWLDTGTHDSLLEASNFIKTIETRQGLKVSCIEEIAYKYGYIDKFKLEENARKYNNEYGDYLMSLIP